MAGQVDHLSGETFHGRKGAVENGFRYTIDYVLLDAEAPIRAPSLFSRNRAGLVSLWDRDHGGAPGEGRGAAWVREVLAERGVGGVARIELLAQPRVLGHVFNPVSFWLCRNDRDALIAVIAEVTNTYGDRHSYLCHHDDLSPIRPTDHLRSQKVFHVSPFQPVEGAYTFRFDIGEERIGIWIDYDRPDGGLLATLTGARAPLRNGAILKAMWRRPLGARRVLALIHWQALKLWWKGASFRARPTPPENDLSR